MSKPLTPEDRAVRNALWTASFGIVADAKREEWVARVRDLLRAEMRAERVTFATLDAARASSDDDSALSQRHRQQ